MKKYILLRTLRSLLSIFVVTALTYTIIYTMVPRRLIFRQDPNYNKIAKTADSKANYENTIYERMGYIDYYDTKELQEKASSVDKSVTTKPTKENKAIYQKYVDSLGRGWRLHQFKQSKQFYATRDVPVLERVFGFYTHLFEFDNTGWVKDKTNPNLKRYIRIENDPAIGWSVVGSGTKHKYLLYFNSQFPFVHQNFVKMNLGTSYPTYAEQGVLDVITQGQGQTQSSEVNFPTGKKISSVDIYSRTYKSPSQADARDRSYYGDDPFATTWNDTLSGLATGEVAMTVNGSYTIAGVTSINPDARIGAFAFPTSEDPSGAVVVMKPGSSFCVYNSSDADKVAAAKGFLSFLTSEEAAVQFVELTSGITAHRVDTKTVEGIDDINAYTGDSVYVNAAVTEFSMEYLVAEYEQIVSYLMGGIADTDELAKKLDEAFATIE